MEFLAGHADAMGWKVSLIVHPDDVEYFRGGKRRLSTTEVVLGDDEGRDWLAGNFSKAETVVLLDLTEKEYRECSFLREWGWKVATFTLFDFGESGRYEDVTIFPDYAVDRSWEREDENGVTRFFSGRSHILVRDAFFAGEGGLGEAHDRSMLVTLGGSDPMLITERVIEALEGIEDVEIAVVLGLANPRREKLRSLAPAEWRILEQGSFDFAHELKRASVALINGGMTRYECVAARTPFAAVSLHDYQFSVTEKLVADGFGFNLGIHDQLPARDLRTAVQQILGEDEGLSRMRKLAPKLISKNGTEAVLDAVGSALISCQP